jgi:hypothetical protein
VNEQLNAAGVFCLQLWPARRSFCAARHACVGAAAVVLLVLDWSVVCVRLTVDDAYACIIVQLACHHSAAGTLILLAGSHKAVNDCRACLGRAIDHPHPVCTLGFNFTTMTAWFAIVHYCACWALVSAMCF